MVVSGALDWCHLVRWWLYSMLWMVVGEGTGCECTAEG